MDKATLHELTKLGEWAENECKYADGQHKTPFFGLCRLISILTKEPAPDPKPEPRVDAEVQLDDLIYRLPRPIPVRACDVCGTVCGAAYCADCKHDAVTLRLDIHKARETYLEGEFKDDPDIPGFEHDYKCAKNAYLRRIEKRKEANR